MPGVILLSLVLHLSLLSFPILVTPSAHPSISDLVKMLGSESYAVREQATQALFQREDAAHAIRQLLTSRDQEVVRRARRILSEYERLRLRRELRFITKSVKDGELDLAIESAVRKPPVAEERICWQAILGLNERLIEYENRTWRYVIPPDGRAGRPREKARDLLARAHFIAAPRVNTNTFKRNHWPYMIRTGELSGEDLCCPTLASGSVRVDQVLGAELLSGDSVTVRLSTFDCLIICDGDFEARQVTKSLIIARGRVKIDSVSESTVLSGRQITVKDYVDRSAIISVGAVIMTGKLGALRGSCLIKENQSDALGPVKFFDLAAAGLKVESAADGLRIQNVTANTPFARAGLRAGDVIRAVDEAKVASYEPFRRLIRRKLVLEEEAIFRVRRGDATLDLAVVIRARAAP